MPQAEGLGKAKTPILSEAFGKTKTPALSEGLDDDVPVLAVKALVATRSQRSNKLPCHQKSTKMTAKRIFTSNRFGCLESCAIIG